MIDKRLWSGAIAVVTLIVAGASALPELLLRPASAPTVIVPTTTQSVAKAAQTATPERSVPGRAPDRIEPVAPPQETIAAARRVVVPPPEMPRAEPLAPATPVPAPPLPFPPMQPLIVGAASVPTALPPANPPATEATPSRTNAEKPLRPERVAWRPEKPKKTVRPAFYPIGEFLAWRR
jgi:hypothetical protein